MSFESMIGLVAPGYAAKRAKAKLDLARYEAAKTVVASGYGNYAASHNRSGTKSWFADGGSSKQDIDDHIDTLRKRSRDAVMGVPLAAAAVKTVRTNVIAGGLVPTPQVDGEALGMEPEQVSVLQAQIVREFALWAESVACDSERRDNFYQLQKIAFYGMVVNGDTPALMEMKEMVGTPYKTCVKILEADQLCSPNQNDRLYPCKVEGHDVQRIVQGVETNESGEICAYWFCNHHPLDSTQGEKRWERVIARGEKTGRPNVIHLFDKERSGQRRGVPMLAPVLESIKQLGRYTQAELDAAVVAALFTVFVERQEESDDSLFGEFQKQSDTEKLGDFAPGMDAGQDIKMGNGAIISLAPGEKANIAAPGRPNAGFEAFYNAVTMDIASGMEIPVEVLRKQFSTSFSAARGALNEFWRTCGMLRDLFSEQFCQPIYEAWFSEAVALGRIKAPGYWNDPIIRKAYTNCMWNGPARTNLNPVQEVQAAQQRVENGFTTAEQETAQISGGSYEANMRQRKIEQRLKREVEEIGSTQPTVL